MTKDVTPDRIRYVLRRAWRLVHWRIAAIIVFTGHPPSLSVCLSGEPIRRSCDSDHAGACTSPPGNSVGLKPLLAYTDEAFPEAQASLIVERPSGVQVVLAGSDRGFEHPDWIPYTNYAGLVVDGGSRTSGCSEP